MTSLKGEKVDVRIEISDVETLRIGLRMLRFNIKSEDWDRTFVVGIGDTINITFDPHSIIKGVKTFTKKEKKLKEIAEQMAEEYVSMERMIKLQKEYRELNKRSLI